MANEGIMALPQGTGMQGEQPQMRQPQQTVTSAESYDAAQTALGMVNPQEQVALKEALRQNIGDLQLTPQQLEALIQVFEYVSQHPGDYKNLLQKMIQAKVLDEGDMPAEYDPEFIGAMLAVLNEMQQMQAAGAQEPMDLAPTVQGLQPMNMASGGLADVGQYLASKGRGGDSILAHINPKEAAMLKSRGGSGTINPITGLPEFKGGLLGGVFDAIGDAVKGVVNIAKDVLQSPVGRILGTVALATVLGPAGVGLSMGVAGGVAGAGVSLLGGGSMKEALISGAMGYIGGGGTVMGVNPVSAVGRYLPGLAGGALNTGLATGVIGAGIGKLGGMSTEDALKMGLTSGVSAGAMRAFDGMSQADYDTSTKVFERGMGGDAKALKIYEGGDIGKMKAFLNENPDLSFKIPEPTPAGTTAPGAVGPVGTAVENLSFPEAQYGAGNFRSAGNAGTALPAGPPGFFDKMVTGAKDVYNEYLSPSRAGLPSDAGIFQKYGPLAAAGTATIAAFGGMDSSPAEIDAMTARERERYEESRQRAKERREFMEKGGYGLEKPVLNAPYNPIVPASYSTSPVGTPGTVVPKGVTQNPAGVAQPYNVAGLYGVPLLYGPDGQPRRMANGGVIKRFNEGGDAGYEERRRLAQERQDFLESGGYGLEGNVFDPSQKRVLYRPRMLRLGENMRENNSGDARGPGTDNKGIGQTAYGMLGNLAGEANRVGLTGVGGFLASGIPVGAAYRDGTFTAADLAALTGKVDPGSSVSLGYQGYGGGSDAPGANADGYGGGDAGFGGGSQAFAKGGPTKMTQFPRRDGPINGPGTGTSDDIPAMLSDGEFVFTAKAVRNAGGGSRRKGAARMYKLMKKLEGGAVKGN